MRFIDSIIFYCNLYILLNYVCVKHKLKNLYVNIISKYDFGCTQINVDTKSIKKYNIFQKEIFFLK